MLNGRSTQAGQCSALGGFNIIGIKCLHFKMNDKEAIDRQIL